MPVSTLPVHMYFEYGSAPVLAKRQFGRFAPFFDYGSP
jgi:hypothetical protein